MSIDLYDGLPTLATLAFHGQVSEPVPGLSEADLDDPQVKQRDLDDLADAEDDHGDYDPDLGSYESGPSAFGLDFGDEDAIFGKGL